MRFVLDMHGVKGRNQIDFLHLQIKLIYHDKPYRQNDSFLTERFCLIDLLDDIRVQGIERFSE